jgi:hypothetical protein
MMPSERQLLAYDGVEGELAEEKRGFAGDVSNARVQFPHVYDFYGDSP